MKAQIDLTNESEIVLLKIKQLGILNNISARNKQEQINLGLEWLGILLDKLDAEDLQNILNIKLI